MIDIRLTSIAEIFSSPNFETLRDQYIAEGKVAGMPHPDVKEAAYRLMESQGAMTCYGAFMGDLLVGFAVLLAPVIPHYGVHVVTADSLFVGWDYRKTGAGLRLIRTIERFARGLKAPGILLSSPSRGRLAGVLPRMGYHETHQVFFKRLRS